ncbi:MAG: M20 family peptidase [Eubacterium sp.]
MKIFLIILAVIAALIIITAVKAVFYKAKPVEITPMPKEKVDSERVQKHLSQAIQIKTISNPDDDKVDWSEFDRFHDFLDEAYPLIHGKLKKEDISQASLLYTWEGKNKDLEPIALLSHQDVVPVAESTYNDWKHDPFEGYNDGEFIWGRGAVDMKNHLICVMDAVEALLEEGFEPERTVYLCFGHNEEIVAGKNNGANAIMNTLKERGVHLDSTLDEGGAIIKANVKGLIEGNLAGVGIAEKGYADYKITVKAKGGHSSQPPKHTAAGAISNVVRDLENHQFKARMLPSVYNLFSGVGKHTSFPARMIMCNLRFLKPVFFAAMKQFPPAATFIRTTTACTMLSGSPASNVLPQTASVTVNFRELPGDTLADTEAHIRRVVKNKDIDVEFLKGKEASKVSSTDSKSFKAIEKLALQISDKNIVAPFLVMGGTDSYHYEEICDNMYRFSPFTIDASIMLTTHGTDERIPVDQLTVGVEFFKRYIKEMNK